MPAVGLFKGRGHVCEFGNEEFLGLAGRPIIGIPVTEAFSEERYAVIRRALDEAYATGDPVILEGFGGRIVIRPRWEHGEVMGVSLVFRLQPAERRPQPQDPPAQLVHAD